MPRPATDTWRVFIAIEMPSEVRARLAEHSKSLRQMNPDVRASWARQENLHLTVKFLGEIPIARMEALSLAAEAATREIDQFDLIVGSCGAFPGQGQPRVLWIGIEDQSGKLARLHKALEKECAKAGFAREARPFHPHLTIARVRQPRGSRTLAQLHKQSGFASESVAVSELVVIRSELSSEGSKYTIISRHAF